MTPDTLFQLANPLAALGWLALLGYPLAPRPVTALAGVAIPTALATLYTGLILAHFATAPGGFDSLANVRLLFTDPWLLLAGWIHYLAFDLAIGAWQARDARARDIPHLLMLPVLGLTFLFGPAGWLTYLTLRSIASTRKALA